MHKKDYHMAPARDMREKSEEGVWETVKVIIQALLIAFFVRTFFYQPFNIPSESMYPTLKVGDYLFVSKLSYGYSKYSFNFSFGGFGTTWIKCCPIDFPGRVVLADTPKRGDVAVFKLPRDTSQDYIKRIIGLPGDSIQMIDGILNINGKPVPRERIDDFIDEDEGGRATRVRRWKETLPNGVSYTTLDLPYNLQADNTEVYRVPPDNYFMMGDNRHNSTDSRFPQVGYVPFENIVGRAQLIFFSVHEGERAWEVWRWPFSVRWSRLFTIVR